MTLGERLKVIRDKLNMTIDQLATELYVNRNTIINYEGNKTKPKKQFLSLLSQKYNINLEWLISGKGSIFTESSDVSDLTIKDILILLNEIHDSELKKKAILSIAKSKLKEESLTKLFKIVDSFLKKHTQ